jgi:hypothetical protein
MLLHTLLCSLRNPFDVHFFGVRARLKLIIASHKAAEREGTFETGLPVAWRDGRCHGEEGVLMRSCYIKFERNTKCRFVFY